MTHDSLREIGVRHNYDHSVMARKARAEGWKRDLSVQIRNATRAFPQGAELRAARADHDGRSVELQMLSQIRANIAARQLLNPPYRA